MVRVTVEQTVRCTPDEFLALVMDARRYAQIDDKLGPIDWIRQDGDVTQFKFRSRLPGLRGPMPKIVSQMTLTPGQRVDVEYAPVPENRMTQRISTFAASFICAPAPEGTQVTRTVEFGFIPPLSWFMEPILRRTLPPDVEREVRGAKDLIEQDTAASAP
jgi:Polyketide cyclase / dehydrase and lipid transport